MGSTSGVALGPGRTIGPGRPCFLVAEIGNNHQGAMDLAREMVRRAAQAGADAVKAQKRDVDSLLTTEGRDRPYPGPNSFGPTYGDHRKAVELSRDQMAELKELAESLGMAFFASVWDETSLEQMAELDVPLLKIASADLTTLPLLRRAAATGKPLALSTGMSGWEEIDAAVACVKASHERIILLHCNSSYPCPEEDIGLPVMEELRRRYGLPVGYSGHEAGMGPSVAAAALSACMVERHVTLDRSLPGTDHAASLTLEEFGLMARLIREAEAAMQLEEKRVSDAERRGAAKLRKSIVFTRDMPAGRLISEADIAAKCPGDGVSCLHWDQVVGRRLIRPVRFEEPFTWDLALEEDQAEAEAPEAAGLAGFKN
jgi:N-acetylneuraminate synthase/sialic acid synthase